MAADRYGNVFVAWHGNPPGNQDGEQGRAVFVARSEDNGETFAAEFQANSEPTGACACCGMKAFVDSNGRLYLLYRAANSRSRDMTLLTSTDHGVSFGSKLISQWFIQACPMSSAAIAETREGILVATESGGRVEWVNVSPVVSDPGLPHSVSPQEAKHPAIVTNRDGDILVAWAEGAAWGKGGELGWRLSSSDGELFAVADKLEAAIPTWSFPAVVSADGGNVLVIY